LTIKQTSTSIDLTNCNYRDYSDEEKEQFKPVRRDFAEQAEPLLKALKNDKTILSVKGKDFSQLHKLSVETNEIIKAIEWIDRHREMLDETRRANLTTLNEELKPVVEIARATSKVDSKVGDTFAAFFDWLDEPAKQRKSTKGQS
jgi:hypothetical protein